MNIALCENSNAARSQLTMKIMGLSSQRSYDQCKENRIIRYLLCWTFL